MDGFKDVFAKFFSASSRGISLKSKSHHRQGICAISSFVPPPLRVATAKNMFSFFEKFRVESFATG